MNAQRQKRGISVVGEAMIAVSFATAAVFVLSPARMGRIDEMLVTFMAIVVGAAIPGIALTAASPRPAASSPREARDFGAALSAQVRFWFGFLWTGGLAVLFVMAGRAVDWHLNTMPRPSWLPAWTPEGGAWLVFPAVAASVFVAIRARHIVTAVQSIISIGTQAHIEQIAERERLHQAAVAAEMARIPKDLGRGAPLDERQRH